LGDQRAQTQKAVSRFIELYESWGKPEKANPYRALPHANPDKSKNNSCDQRSHPRGRDPRPAAPRRLRIADGDGRGGAALGHDSSRLHRDITGAGQLREAAGRRKQPLPGPSIESE